MDLKAPWEKLARRILNKVIQSNLKGEFIPLWGTCLGFELIATLLADTKAVLVKTEGVYNVATPLEFDISTVKKARMFKYFNDNDFNSLRTENTTAEYHHWGITQKSFDKYVNLDRYLKITSFGRDTADELYIATYEGKHLPIYAVQFHPEKIPYDRKPTDNVPQFGNAIKISQNLGLFLADELRKNNNTLTETEKEKYQVIDTYKTKATLFSDGIYYYFFHK